MRTCDTCKHYKWEPHTISNIAGFYCSDVDCMDNEKHPHWQPKNRTLTYHTISKLDPDQAREVFQQFTDKRPDGWSDEQYESIMQLLQKLMER